MKKPTPSSARRVRGGLPCPDCDFVARHAMGLGRHRSARHGVPSRRSQAPLSKGQWVTRTQAAQLAGVHYNTIRLWEGAGKVRSERRPGVRGKLVNVADLGRMIGEMQVERYGVGALNGAGKKIEARFDRLIANLEKMLEAARS